MVHGKTPPTTNHQPPTTNQPLPTPNSSFLNPKSSSSRIRAEAGATLLVTLGVLAVLSVMVVTFLLTSRHQSLSAKHFADKTVARQTLDVALSRAMQFADEAMIASNYNGLVGSSQSAESRQRRVAPVGRWYSKNYETAAQFPASPPVQYQTQDVLLVPVTNNNFTAAQENTRTVNLLTKEVLDLLPPALTNRLARDTAHPFRSGWIADSESGVRISFAVLNCSSFIDAHTYDFSNGRLLSATQHCERAYFTRKDLVNAKDNIDVPDLDKLDAFGVFSYDPGRDAMPLYPKNNGVSLTLGYRDFSITNKFNINSITNFFDHTTDPYRLKATRLFEEQWLKPVTNALGAANLPNEGVSLGSAQKVAWNIANYMSPSRVPVISYPGVALASRADYGVEDVPLINEVQVFKCTDNNVNAVDGVFEKTVSDLQTTLKNNLENYVAAHGTEGTICEPVVMTNIYAAAVEVWYPFSPRPIPFDTRVFVGVYTNQDQVATTTNSNWTATDLADYYGLNNPSAAELSISLLNDLFVNDPDSLTNSTFWSGIQNNVLVVSAIENPSTFNETNLLPIATGLATGLVWVYTDPNSGRIAADNPYTDLIYFYAPADTNMTPDEATTYYAMASNYVPVVTIVLTNRVEDLFGEEGGSIIEGAQTIVEKNLPASKIEVGAFDVLGPNGYRVGNGQDFDFNTHGFCVVTNTKTLICFPSYTLSSSEGSGRSTAHVDLSPLDGAGGRFAWIRPLVAIKEENGDTTSENNGYEAVDEALLTEENSTISVLKWSGVNSYSVADPRANAWASLWYNNVANTFGSTNEIPLGWTFSCPAELPFIHADVPFQSIGELGHITIDLNKKADNKAYYPNNTAYDTIDFATRAGAATLDRFTIASSNAPLYGLIQANTTYADVIQQIHTGIPMGWTNGTGHVDEQEHGFALSETDDEVRKLTANWTNTLFRTESGDEDLNGRPGWSCFADMLPDLSTNATLRAELDFSSRESDKYYSHDYIEDVMRGIIDKVSFRQNIFVVVIAAQTLSPASTDEHPIILADQRAAVTVIRDAYTGRWAIYNWTWLTE